MKRNVLRGTLVAALIGTSVLAVPASAEEAKSEEAKSYEIGMTVADLTNPIWAEVCDEVQKKGEEMGSTFTVVAAIMIRLHRLHRSRISSSRKRTLLSFLRLILILWKVLSKMHRMQESWLCVMACIPTHTMYPIQMIMQVQDS